MVNLYNGFDYFGYYENPTMTLCNPNKKTLHVLSKIKDRRLQLNFSAVSTFSFTAYEYLNGKKNDYYDDLQSKRLVHIDGIGYFIIQQCNETTYKDNSTKEIVANSLEFELSRKKVNILSGTYKFYDPLDVDNSLLGMVLKVIPTWSIGDIDVDLWNEWRQYDIDDNNIYNFLTSNVSETLECIFTFDIENRKVNATAAKNIVNKTDIYMSHKNLIDNVKITEMSDEICTALAVTGGNDLLINLVNPLGDRYIYNFNYYKNTDWMSQELVDTIDAWEKLIEDNKAYHNTLLTKYYDAYELLDGTIDNVDDSGYNGKLTKLKEDLSDLEVVLAARVQEYNVNKNDDTKKAIKEIKAQITDKKAEIEDMQSKIDKQEDIVVDMTSKLHKLADSLSFENNFSEELYLELLPYIHESSYQNENYIKTDSMKYCEIQEQATALYNQSLKVLERVSQPRYQFEVDSANIIFLEEFSRFAKQLTLGSEIYTEVKDEVIFRPVLLQINLNYDNPTDFSMKFSNRLKLNDNEFIYAELMEDAIKTSTTVSINSGSWSNFNKNYKSTITEFINSALDASKNNIVTSSNQDFVIDKSGLHGRKIEDNVLDPHELWINNSSLMFTQDNWVTKQLQ